MGMLAKDPIRVLAADDDESILECYRAAFSMDEGGEAAHQLEDLEAELFGDAAPADDSYPCFDLVSCRQGEEAVEHVACALAQGRPFDVVFLDVRMPPGINGVEAGERIRALDPAVTIIFVTGYSDVEREELQERIPPPDKLHYLSKPVRFSDLADMAGRLGV